MTTINRAIYPADKMHLKNIHTGEIVPAKSLSEAEYQAYLTAEEEIPDSEALEIITGGADI